MYEGAPYSGEVDPISIRSRTRDSADARAEHGDAGRSKGAETGIEVDRADSRPPSGADHGGGRSHGDWSLAGSHDGFSEPVGPGNDIGSVPLRAVHGPPELGFRAADPGADRPVCCSFVGAG